MRRRRSLLALPLFLAFVLAVPAARPAGFAAADLPARLSDQEFWRLSTDMSEPDGSFRSENLVSNEMVLAQLLPVVTGRAKSGGVYLGVGPEQNSSRQCVPALAS